MWQWLKSKLFGEKESVLMLLLALFHKETPLKIRLLLIFAIGYLLSPIDLLPDGIAGVGLIDDFIIVPTLLYVAERLLPTKVERDVNRMRQRLHKYIPWIIAGILVIFIGWIVLWIYLIYKLFTM